MICVSRPDKSYAGEGHNQSPNPLSNDQTTNEDLNGMVNTRRIRSDDKPLSDCNSVTPPDDDGTGGDSKGQHAARRGEAVESTDSAPLPFRSPSPNPDSEASGNSWVGLRIFRRLKNGILKFGSFIGPGFMIAVAYIDPGNYATDIAAGASYRFRLLFIVLLANLFAIFLQTLCIKLGTVTGLNLAESCRAFLPRWLNYVLYFFAEAAIIATDIAEVIGFAIGLNLLAPAIPLVAGCAISILDVMIILFFYRPHGSMSGLRVFEYFIIGLVLSVVVCFCIQLSLVQDTSIGDVFMGYLPSGAIVEQQGLYQACGILGATVMPHSLYLGSGIVQPRLREYDAKHGLLPTEYSGDQDGEGNVDNGYYVPSLQAIRHSLKASSVELATALFTFALFVNSAILIVAGISLYNNPEAPDADIFSIHKLLTDSISPAAGTIFALALLLSGVSAGIVCTIAGQMVSEGALNWRLRPWLRRLVTRSISITPSIIIAGAVGKKGLNEALNASQVVLSVILPFVTAPLIFFTCMNKYMTIQPDAARYLVTSGQGGGQVGGTQPLRAGEHDTGLVKMANSWYTVVFAALVWIIITGMNVANLVLLGRGN